jgi:phosphopantothenoylcysteine decarboxylase/phosphopantothenate--cysteine ligase
MSGTEAADGRPAPLVCDRLLVAVTGSPAALAIPQYLLMLRSTLARDVRVMMSRGARRFLRPSTLRLFAGGWVHTDAEPPPDGVLVPHIELTRDVDLMLVMPATANIIGKAAHGICDELISTAIVACPAPVVLMPAMNGTMWASKAVQRNVELTRELGYHVIEPGTGFQLSDLAESSGQMAPLEAVLEELVAILRTPRTPHAVAS